MKGSNREFLNFSQVHIGHLPTKLLIPTEALQYDTIYHNYLVAPRSFPRFHQFRSKGSYYSPAAGLIAFLQLRWAYEISRMHKELSDEIEAEKSVKKESEEVMEKEIDLKVIEERKMAFLIDGIVHYLDKVDVVPDQYKRLFAIQAARSILFPKKEMGYPEIFILAYEGLRFEDKRPEVEVNEILTEGANKILPPLLNAMWEYSAQAKGHGGKSREERVRELMREKIKEIGAVKKLAMRERKFYEALIGVFEGMVDSLFPAEESKS